MPDKDEMERRLWRTMRWDRETMEPTPETDAAEEEMERWARTDTCVCCGRTVPDGRMVCSICQGKE